MTYTYKALGHFGALGNQLFQIASTIGIALDNGDRPSFPAWEYQPYFAIPYGLFDGLDGKDHEGEYLQDIKYFDHYFPLIQKYFSPSQYSLAYLETVYPDIMHPKAWATKHLAVHVRRANNLGLPDHHPVCPIEYFEAGVEYIKTTSPVGFEWQLVVFSDDIPWCKEQEVFKDAVFANGNKPDVDTAELTGAHPLSLGSAAFDLLLMSFCDAWVISNSTFSWWGAYLGNKNRVVWPVPWYGPALSHIDVEGTMILPTWTGLDR